MKINFSKYQATGNDFILLDNRDEKFSALSKENIEWLCDRRFGIGADGLMLLNNAPGNDFEMKYYNADGAVGSMCGNGGRCIVAFAFRQGIKKDKYHFIAFDGRHEAVYHDDLIRLKMNPVKAIRKTGNSIFLDTGSPHYVEFLENIATVDVVTEGRKIRNSPAYKREGVNVNFVERKGGDRIFVRTYERGVEDETYSCGTGVTAAAIASGDGDLGVHHIEIETKGGRLSVDYKKTENEYIDIWLTGPADFVFSGIIELKDK